MPRKRTKSIHEREFGQQPPVPPGLAVEFQKQLEELEKTWKPNSTERFGTSTALADNLYSTDNDEAIDVLLEKARVEAALKLILSPIVDSHLPKPSKSLARIKIKDLKLHREEQALKYLLGKELQRGRSSPVREKTLLRIAELYWLVLMGREHYPTLDSIIKAIVLTPKEQKMLEQKMLKARQVDARIKHYRQAFNENKPQLLRQVSHTDLQLGSYEQKLISEIHDRLAALEIISRKPILPSK